MAGVKRIEAVGLHGDMKQFAFDQSVGLREGTHSGYEVTRTFWHFDPMSRLRTTDEISVEACRSTFYFSIFRMGGNRQKPMYKYDLEATLCRTLPGLPALLLSRLDPEIREEHSDFAEISPGALEQTMVARYETSDFELGEIAADIRYSLSYLGDEIHVSTEQHIMYGQDVELVQIPGLEATDEEACVIVPPPILEERYSPVDGIINDANFWEIVNPMTEVEATDEYRAGAAAIRGILHALKTGEII
jgi:hypothetical protein